ENILDPRLLIAFQNRERQEQLMGYRKRGPKPKPLVVQTSHLLPPTRQLRTWWGLGRSRNSRHAVGLSPPSSHPCTRSLRCLPLPVVPMS
ncbi:CBX4 isoform 3, partial [Pan troglodytes]